MNQANKNGMRKIESQIPFVQMMLTNVEGAELNYDFCPSRRILAIEKAVKARNGSEITLNPKNQFSSQFVVQQAVDRYFRLISSAVESINSIFTESEMKVILKAICRPFCQWCVGETVADMVADDLGIEQTSDLSDDSDVKTLLNKLMRLSPTQNVALIDLCERFWRSSKDRSLKDVFNKMNFVFAD